MTTRLDLSALRSAVSSLEAALGVVSDAPWFESQAPPVRHTLIAGVIQNFEFGYEVCIKMIRRQLEIDAATPAEVDETNYRELLRRAGEKGLIADVEAWFEYRRLRNITAHTYNRNKAEEVFAGSRGFFGAAKSLLTALESRNA